MHAQLNATKMCTLMCSLIDECRALHDITVFYVLGFRIWQTSGNEKKAIVELQLPKAKRIKTIEIGMLVGCAA